MTARRAGLSQGIFKFMQRASVSIYQYIMYEHHIVFIMYRNVICQGFQDFRSFYCCSFPQLLNLHQLQALPLRSGRVKEKESHARAGAAAFAE